MEFKTFCIETGERMRITENDIIEFESSEYFKIPKDDLLTIKDLLVDDSVTADVGLNKITKYSIEEDLEKLDVGYFDSVKEGCLIVFKKEVIPGEMSLVEVGILDTLNKSWEIKTFDLETEINTIVDSIPA